jgi:ketosteroid isomerase-like protein
MSSARSLRRIAFLALFLVAAVLLEASPAAGAEDPVPSPSDPQLVAALTGQADRWDKAIVRKDRAAIEANMADDFRNIDGQGGVYDKKAFVDDLLSPDLVIDPYAVEELDVRLFGDVALLSGRTRMTGTYKAKPFTSHYRYIDIYVRRAGVWKVVSVQISKIPD